MRLPGNRSATPASHGVLGHAFATGVGQRPTQRKTALLQGVIAWLDGGQAVDCTIRCLSESGARIAVPKQTQFPSDFYLISLCDRMVYGTSVAWCGVSEAGVNFARTFALADMPDPALPFLKRIWMSRAVR